MWRIAKGKLRYVVSTLRSSPEVLLFYERQKLCKPGHHQIRIATLTITHSGRERSKGVMVILGSKSDLMQIVQALYPSCEGTLRRVVGCRPWKGGACHGPNPRSPHAASLAGAGASLATVATSRPHVLCSPRSPGGQLLRLAPPVASARLNPRAVPAGAEVPLPSGLRSGHAGCRTRTDHACRSRARRWPVAAGATRLRPGHAP